LDKQDSLLIKKTKVRALLFDQSGHLMLFRRTRPGIPVYWVAPGGGVEDTDPSLEAALDRELFEELGATADITREALELEYPEGNKAHFFVCRLQAMDIEKRNGPEFLDGSRGQYDIELVDLENTAQVCGLDYSPRGDIKPAALKEFLLQHPNIHQEDAAPVSVKSQTHQG
jgi:8-oxo-dGTP pyrophosphatase MutT (NUDIX family)